MADEVLKLIVTADTSKIAPQRGILLHAQPGKELRKKPVPFAFLSIYAIDVSNFDQTCEQ